MNDDNPLLLNHGLPAFDRIRPQHVEPGVRALLAKAAEHLSEAESAATGDWDALMTPLEKIDLLFEYGWSPISHLLGVANSDELRAAHEAMLPRIVEFSLTLKQSQALYSRFLALRDSPAWQRMNSAQQRIIRQSILSAEQSGIGLEGEARERFNQIEHRLSQLGSDFSNNVLDATRAWHLDLTSSDDAEGLPLSLRRMAAAAWSAADENKDQEAATPEAGPWRIKLEVPSFGPFMEHCRNRDLREQAYRAYISRASSGEKDNSPLITEILTLRQEKCDLLGYDNYAALSLSRKMAADVDAVKHMFDELLEASLEAGTAELAELTELAQQNGHEGALAHWDIAFWAERLREQRYAYTDEELRPYFSLERVLDGLFGLCHRLFGITVRSADGKAPVWHPDVRFFEVLDDQNNPIASFYLDPYSRPEDKRGGAWMGDCIVRSVTSDETRLPVAHLVCNGTPPVGETPSLMTFREVETLFHEFGHGLQHMLTTVDLRDAAGINGVEWDAVELPSQFMENWCYHRTTLLGMAVHYETGEVLPEDLYQKICRARTFRAASQMLRQLQFGMTDMELHTTFDPQGPESVFDVHNRIAQQTSPLPPLPENRFLCSFSHIFAGGYAAGYYSYKWAEVLSADAFSAFEEAGLDNDDAVAETGRRFRNTVLAEGGSRHPMDIYRDFRGREPDTKALLRHNGLLKA
ncbi:MAG: M3 family metallopeptidase [Fuerstiella sp.]